MCFSKFRMALLLVLRHSITISPAIILKGTYSAENSTECIVCPAGSYCPSPAIAPFPCPHGSYATGGKMVSY